MLSPRMFLELKRRSYIYQLKRPDVLEPTRLTAGKTYLIKAELGPSAGLLGACAAGLESSTAPIGSGKELLAHQ